MKKALDYASDYQLESACKDALCIALSTVSLPKRFLLFLWTVIITSFLHMALNW